MSDFISPIAFEKCYLSNINFDLREAFLHFRDQPDLSSIKHELEVGHAIESAEENDAFKCKCTLILKWDVSTLNEDEEMNPLFHAEAEIVGFSSCLVGGKNPEEVTSVLNASTVGFLWAKIRDIFDDITGQSIIGRVMLPPITPQALLEEEKKEISVE